MWFCYCQSKYAGLAKWLSLSLNNCLALTIGEIRLERLAIAVANQTVILQTRRAEIDSKSKKNSSALSRYTFSCRFVRNRSWTRERKKCVFLSPLLEIFNPCDDEERLSFRKVRGSNISFHKTIINFFVLKSSSVTIHYFRYYEILDIFRLTLKLVFQRKSRPIT